MIPGWILPRSISTWPAPNTKESTTWWRSMWLQLEDLEVLELDPRIQIPNAAKYHLGNLRPITRRRRIRPRRRRITRFRILMLILLRGPPIPSPVKQLCRRTSTSWLMANHNQILISLSLTWLMPSPPRTMTFWRRSLSRRGPLSVPRRPSRPIGLNWRSSMGSWPRIS